MHDLIFFVLQASQSSKAPGLQWIGGSPIAGAPPTWPPLPPAGFWLPSGPGFCRPPLKLYPGQPGGHRPPQMGQGYWQLLPPPLGSALGGHVPLPFGSPLFRSQMPRPMTSTPPIVRNYFAILTHLFCIPNTSICVSFRVAQHHKVAGRDMTLLTPS
jgi:hypothetical protein